MKILQVGKFYPPHMGGIETHVQVLCRQLQRRADVEVLVANESSETEEFWDEEIQITRLATRFNFSTAPICPQLAGRIRRAKADIVQLHLPNPPAILSFLASGYRGPVIATYHSDIVRQAWMAKAFDPILRMFLNRCSAIIATSSRYVETSPVLSRYADRCHVIPYGIPTEHFSKDNNSEIARIRERYGPRLIISAGRLIYYKGFEYLIEAMSHVEGHLLIVGDGPLRQDLENRTRALELQSKITFLGEIHNQDIVPFFQAADIFALASVARSEAFGIVQLEAMACGTPVINTNLDSGVPSVSLDGVTGITVPPRDPRALANAINLLLDNTELRENYGKAGRIRVEKEFDQAVMLERTWQLYQQVLGVMSEDAGKISAKPAAAVAASSAN